MITSPPYDEASFVERLEFALERGIKLVQLRAKEMRAEDYKKLSSVSVKICHRYDAKVLLSTRTDFVAELNADGVHLPSHELMKLKKRPLDDNCLISAACHNEEQVMNASKINVDLIIVSPIFSTPSSPNGIPLGWSKFQDLARLSSVPVYALGGLSTSDLDTAKVYGATGIAAIREFMNDKKF